MIIPFHLEKNQTILVAGCGGGYDVVSAGLPVGLALEQQGHRVIYASYSFTNLPSIDSSLRMKIPGTSPGSITLPVDKDTTIPQSYFPEKYMAQWYHQVFGRDLVMYCYTGHGTRSMANTFTHLKDLHGLDMVFLVDGGADGLMFGDEYDLATPTIDAVSIIGAEQSAIPKVVYVVSAFGSEGIGQEFSHAEALRNMGTLISQDAMLGVSSVLNDKGIKSHYLSLYRYMQTVTNARFDRSVIQGSVAESLQGSFGFCSYNTKTEFAPVWVSALTSLLWFFDNAAVARNKLYYEAAKDLLHYHEVNSVIEAYIKKNERPKPNIPI